LDPFATGVLLICINEGTKLVPFLMEEEKEYEAALCLGIETDTQDLTGKVIREDKAVTATPTDIENAFRRFQGKISQIPPMYSALKRDGVPLYRLARQGKEIERTKRDVEIRELVISAIELPRVFFRVVCSKGTYVRTLASDIGRVLGCGASLEMLKRVRTGDFLLRYSLDLDDLGEKTLEEIETEWLVPLSRALPSITAVTIDEAIARQVRLGRIITCGDLRDLKLPIPPGRKEKFKILDPQGRMIAMAETLGLGNGSRDWGKPAWKLLRVFNAG
jgi:tRNA pseudouridine55 synthase